MRSKEQVSTQSATQRYEPVAVYHMAEQVKAEGVDLSHAEGPWRPAVRALNRPGRKSFDKIPLVTNEQTEVMVDTMEHATDVAGLLNWCGVHELDPVPELVPPVQENPL